MIANIHEKKHNQKFSSKIGPKYGKKPSQNSSEKRVSLDTLAQLRNSEEKPLNNLVSCVHISDKQNLKKRAKKKYFTSGIIYSLINAAEQNEDSTLLKSYWNSWHCSNLLVTTKTGKITGKYCGNRWCMVCNGIRTAKSINKYKPIIDSWDNKYFVTLTEKNCKDADLKGRINEMLKFSRKINDSALKRKKPLVGIRKLEVTHNYRTDEYNPHFHFIVESKEMAQYIIDGWIQRNQLAKAPGQDIRKASDNSSIELFKYMTKIVSTIKGKKEETRVINGKNLDIIFNALKGRRILQPFGFKAVEPIETEIIEEETEEEITEGSIFSWIQEATDWINLETGEILSGYVPSEGFEKFVSGNFDEKPLKPYKDTFLII